MALSTAVNDQITDAVTLSHVRVIGEAPASAMGLLYQSMAHSTGILFQNAVAAQQQQNTLAQAAANQGVMQIYSLDIITAASVAEKAAQTGVSDNLTSLLSVLNAFKSGGARPKADVTGDAAPDAAGATSGTNAVAGITDQIQAAVAFSNDAILGNAHAFVSGLRHCVDGMAHAIDSMNRVTHDNMVHLLQEAALSATLAAMIRDPGKAKEYETVLQVVQRMA